jgi:Ca-activated chloride channel family protein
MTLSRSLIPGSILALAAVFSLAGPARSIAPIQSQPSPWLKPDQGMVLAWVSVVDPKGNSVPGLKRNSFHIWENDTEQTIEYFAPNSDPISVGIIPCGSIECAEVPMTFLKTTSWAEEYFVVVENRSARGGGTILQNFTTNIIELPRITPSTHSAGVLSLGLDYMKEAANPRKIILMIAAGLRLPNSGGITAELALRRAVQQEDLQIYSIVTSRFDEIETLEHEDKNKKKQPDPLYAEYPVPALSRATGGRAYYSRFFAADLEKVASEIARGLETQYLIGYRTTSLFSDGKWRPIRIHVDAPAGTPELTVWTKNGYWAEKGKVLVAPKPQ